jgi:hypothetical protein
MLPNPNTNKKTSGNDLQEINIGIDLGRASILVEYQDAFL